MRGVPDRSYHHGDLPNALLDAAEALIRERGSETWSLREVSSRLGVSPSAAYHHFASRDALIGALSARVFAALGSRLQRAAAEARGDHQARLIALGSSYVHRRLSGTAHRERPGRSPPSPSRHAHWRSRCLQSASAAALRASSVAPHLSSGTAIAR